MNPPNTPPDPPDPHTPPPTWPDPGPGWPYGAFGRLGQLDSYRRTSLGLLALSVLMPAVALAQPPQPLRAIAAAGVLVLLPGITLARLARLDDTWLFLLVALTSSAALSILTSTVLMYAGIWSWQLTLVLLGLASAVTSTLTLRVPARLPGSNGAPR